MFGDALLLSARASTLPISSLIISTLYCWESEYRVVVRLPCTHQGVSHRTCLRTTFSLNLTLPSHSIAYTEISCWKESVRSFRSSTHFVILSYSHHLRFNLAIFLFRRRRAHIRVIHLEGFSFVWPYIQSYSLLSLPLRWVLWTTFHLGDLCPPYPQTLT